MALLSLLAVAMAFQAPPYKVASTTAPPESISRIERALVRGVRIVEGYFGKPFPNGFEVVVASKRTEFDTVAARKWKMPASEKWMVGAGAADFLLLLSPDRWKDEAVEHDGGSDKELNDIVAHELVHVYHSQVCPNHDFEGMDEMGWFAEGLAVRVSGQLYSSHRGVALQAVKDGLAPKSLAAAWSGKHRYGVAGSMAKFVEAKWGKRTVLDLLKATSNVQALKRLSTTQESFLRDWRTWVERAEHGEKSESSIN